MFEVAVFRSDEQARTWRQVKGLDDVTHQDGRVLVDVPMPVILPDVLEVLDEWQAQRGHVWRPLKTVLPLAQAENIVPMRTLREALALVGEPERLFVKRLDGQSETVEVDDVKYQFYQRRYPVGDRPGRCCLCQHTHGLMLVLSREGAALPQGGRLTRCLHRLVSHVEPAVSRVRREDD